MNTKKPFKCIYCEGSGYVFGGYGIGNMPDDVQEIWETCNHCNGQGRTWRPPRGISGAIKRKLINSAPKEEDVIPF